MSYGFRVLSSSGYVQIDENYSNYTLLQSGVASGRPADIGYPAQPTPVLIMVRTDYGGIIDDRGSTTGSYEYRIYTRNRDAPAFQSYGVRVYESDGGLAFDSGNRKLRADVLAYAEFTGPSSSYTLGSPGYKPFIAYASFSGIIGIQATGNPQLRTALIGVRAIQNGDNSVTFAPGQLQLIPAPPESIASSFWGSGTKTLMLGE